MFQGLRTVIYHAADLAVVKEWYTKALGVQPYFDQPFYVGYSVGGFELGLVPDGTSGRGGTVAYWGVPNAEGAVQRLQTLGGYPYGQALDQRGGERPLHLEPLCRTSCSRSGTNE